VEPRPAARTAALATKTDASLALAGTLRSCPRREPGSFGEPRCLAPKPPAPEADLEHPRGGVFDLRSTRPGTGPRRRLNGRS
jgi:hypothetical protein